MATETCGRPPHAGAEVVEEEAVEVEGELDSGADEVEVEVEAVSVDGVWF